MTSANPGAAAGPQALDALRARAAALDAADPLADCRGRFAIPTDADGRAVAYFCGNSLGLMPLSASALVEHELEGWARHAVEGHFHSEHRWFDYHEFFRESAAALVGARPGEAVVMNGLTVNLHLMLTSFYRPKGERRAVLVEEGLFPSDDYAVESHLRARGIDPASEVVRLTASEGGHCPSTERAIGAIERLGQRLALVMLPGVQYRTGQWFDMPAITEAAHRVGALAGWDLAHAAGNVPMELHDWGADFAVWCGYKYLNGGPGAPAGCFVHQRHGDDAAIPRLAGWWGNDPATRFRMEPGFHPRRGADGWQLSNPPILAMAPLRASMDIFHDVGMPALREKSLALTALLERAVHAAAPHAEVITPADPDHRGCQLSIGFGQRARAVRDELAARGVVADFREPDVVRLAPVPLYNTYADVMRAADAIAAVAGHGVRPAPRD